MGGGGNSGEPVRDPPRRTKRAKGSPIGFAPNPTSPARSDGARWPREARNVPRRLSANPRSGRGHRRQWSCARVYARGCGGCTSGRAEGCATRERGARGDGQNKSMFSDKGSYAFPRRLTSCPPPRQAHLDIARLSISPRPPEAKRQDKTSRTKRKLN